MLALSLGVPNIYSVESDQAWLEGIKSAKEQAENPYNGLHVCKWVDIGTTGDWGYPTTTTNHMHYWKYPFSAWLSEEMINRPDLVLIDGRFRIACLLATIMYAKSKTTVLFDDYFDRPWYHFIEDIIKPAGGADRMTIFEINGNTTINSKIVETLLASAQDVR